LKVHDGTIAGRAWFAARRARRWLIAYWLLLVLLTHWPNPWPHKGEPKFVDKLVHFSLYAALAWLALHAMTVRRGTLSPAVRCMIVFLVVVAFGLLDEWTQPYTRRDFDWFDWLADTVGAAAGIAVYYAWQRRFRFTDRS